MLGIWGRSVTRTPSLHVLKTLTSLRSAKLDAFPGRVILLNQSAPTERGYATAAKAKKTSTAAAKKTSAGGAKKKAGTVKKASASTVKKTTGTKAGRVKKTAAKKATTKKPVKKTAAKKPVKKVVAKKKPVTKKKKLTEKQLLHAKIMHLRKRALSPPAHTAGSAWTVFLTDKLKGHKGQVAKLFSENKDTWVTEFRSLNPTQLEKLNENVKQNTEARQKQFKEWIESHSPAEIYDANLARRRLRSLRASSGDNIPLGLRTSFPAIPDPRFPKGQRTEVLYYVLDRLKGYEGDRYAIVSEAAKEYKSLPEAQKKKYQEMAAADKVRYRKELRAIGMISPGEKAENEKKAQKAKA